MQDAVTLNLVQGPFLRLDQWSLLQDGC